MRGLIIRDPWIDLILQGKKTWEIRSKASAVREKIALIRGGSGTIVGTVTLADCLGPFTFDELPAHRDKHCVPDGPLAEFREKYKNRAFAWVMRDVVALPEPVPYDHPSGAVIWVTLPEDVSRVLLKRTGAAVH